MLSGVCLHAVNPEAKIWKQSGTVWEYSDTLQNVENIEKVISQVFWANNLRIMIEANKAVINFLGLTLNLQMGEYSPYMKPHNVPLYMHVQSNQPSAMIKQI